MLAELQKTEPAAWRQYKGDVARAQAQYDTKGFVLALGNYHPHVNAVGVPVISADRTRVMALNCGGASAACAPERLVGPVARALKELAGQLSTRLDMVGRH